MTFPKQLIEHYLKYNGGNPINNFLYSEISDIETSVQTFLPLKYKNETGYTIEDMYRHFVGRNVFSGKYLPFAMDYGGNLFCVNMENGEIVEDGPVNVVFDSPDYPKIQSFFQQ